MHIEVFLNLTQEVNMTFLSNFYPNQSDAG